MQKMFVKNFNFNQRSSIPVLLDLLQFHSSLPSIVAFPFTPLQILCQKVFNKKALLLCKRAWHS